MSHHASGPLYCPAELRDGAEQLPTKDGTTVLLWSPVSTQLSQPARQYLRRTLPATAVEVFDGTTESYWHWWLSDARLAMLTSLVVVLDSTGVPVAWAGSANREFGGQQCWYVSTIAVRSDYTSTWVAHTMTSQLLRTATPTAGSGNFYIVGRTGNPVTYAMTQLTGGTADNWPTPGQPVPATIQRIAVDTAAYLGQSDQLDPRTLLVSEAYDNTAMGLWKQRPMLGRPDIDDWFNQCLGPRDAFLVISRFDQSLMDGF